MPKIIVRLATVLPQYVIGYLSPYPTVVMVTKDHQYDSNKLAKCSALASCSTNQIMVPKNGIPIIKIPKTIGILALNICLIKSIK